MTVRYLADPDLHQADAVLWPHASSSNSWIGAASLPTQVLLWCRHQWNPSGSSSYTTVKEENSSIFLGPWYHAKKLLKLKWAKFSTDERTTCTEHEDIISKVPDTIQPVHCSTDLQHPHKCTLMEHGQRLNRNHKVLIWDLNQLWTWKHFKC